MKSLAHSIARICHDVNAAYCAALGDFTQSDWENTSEEHKDSLVKGVMLHLENPNLGVNAGHEAWLAQKRSDGWTYGPLKDPVKKEHPCFVPYADLPPEQRAKDFIFRGVVHAVAREQLR